MRLDADVVHGFTLPCCAAFRCRLRIFEHPDRPTVVLVTAVRDCLVGPPSVAVRSSAARLHADVCRLQGLDAVSLVWIVHFPSSWGQPRQFLSSAGRVKTLAFTASQESNVRGSGSSEAWNKFFKNT
jgi:hypothetical protein